mgnify:CR=1 FL=1
MLIISSNNKEDISIPERLNKFNSALNEQTLFLLIRPEKKVYENESERKLFESNIQKVINKGLINIEIAWNKNKNWLDLVSGLRSKFPYINLGSASIIDKQGINDSIKIGLNYSMMKFWQKEIYLFAKKKNYLLIPGIKNLKDLKKAISLNCKIVKIYPINEKESSLNINKFSTQLSFIAAGGLSISDIKYIKSLGYKGVVVGKNAFNGNAFNSDVLRWLELNHNKKVIN